MTDGMQQPKRVSAEHVDGLFGPWDDDAETPPRKPRADKDAREAPRSDAAPQPVEEAPRAQLEDGKPIAPLPDYAEAWRVHWQPLGGFQFDQETATALVSLKHETRTGGGLWVSQSRVLFDDAAAVDDAAVTAALMHAKKFWGGELEFLPTSDEAFKARAYERAQALGVVVLGYEPPPRDGVTRPKPKARTHATAAPSVA